MENPGLPGVFFIALILAFPSLIECFYPRTCRNNVFSNDDIRDCCYYGGYDGCPYQGLPEVCDDQEVTGKDGREISSILRCGVLNNIFCEISGRKLGDSI